MQSNLTKTQIELGRHALGLPNKSRKSYRNHYVAGDGHSDYDSWQELVELGLAKRYGPKAIFGGDYCYVLTKEGATAMLKRGEKLDAEDFPK